MSGLGNIRQRAKRAPSVLRPRALAPVVVEPWKRRLRPVAFWAARLAARMCARAERLGRQGEAASFARLEQRALRLALRCGPPVAAALRAPAEGRGDE